MNSLVYHGGTETIAQPLVDVGRDDLDFGKGFYITDLKDDRVIDTVNMFISGLMSADVALKRLTHYQPSNQICILNQELLNKYLIYYGTETI